MAYPNPLYAVTRELNGGVYTLSTPFLRSGLMSFGARSTFLKLNNDIAVIAPIPFNNDSQLILNKLGVGARGPKYLIAPDLQHHIGLESWKERYPKSIIIGVEGLDKIESKRNIKVDIQVLNSQKNKLLYASDLGLPIELDDVLNFIYLPSHPNRELITYYAPSKLLIQADVLFNLPANEQYSGVSPQNDIHKGILSNLANYCLGVDSIWQKRILYYLLFRNDRNGINHVLSEINKLDIDFVIPCHGDIFTKDSFLNAFSYFNN